MMRIPPIALGLAFASALPVLADDVKAFAAPSLRAALTEAGTEYRGVSGRHVGLEFAPSPLLRERLSKGERADVFAAANVEDPRSLAEAGLAGPVRIFARSPMCALAASAARVTTANLLERMLDPAVKVGIAPKAEPSGGHARQVFERAERVKRGALRKLEKKALHLAPASSPPHVAGSPVADGEADIFLTYCADAALAKKAHPALEVVALPDALAVSAEHGLVVMKGASGGGERFATFLLTPPGRKVLAAHGYAPP